MTSFSSDSLQSSGAWLQITNSSSLRKVSFPRLNWIGIGLFLIDVPLLEQLELANGVVLGGNSAPATSLSGAIVNTGLSGIDGIFSGAPYDIQIYDNPKLQIINLPTSQIRLQYNSSSTGNLVIVNNNPNITVNLPQPRLRCRINFSWKCLITVHTVSRFSKRLNIYNELVFSVPVGSPTSDDHRGLEY